MIANLMSKTFNIFSKSLKFTMRYPLKKGMKSLNGQVEIIDTDKFSLLIKNISKSATGIRTISKELVNEFVDYFEQHPNNTSQQAREALSGLTQIDKFEYGYHSTLRVLAKMILGEELSDEDRKLSTKISRNDSVESLQVIYYGAPGTGKSFAINDKTDDENSVRTTFHPDSDYASFVGAYKPTMEDIPINSIYGETVQFATGKNGHPGTEKKIVYKFVPQAFLKAYVAAWSNLSKPFYLVIEEINRGNCAQIFGDLFQLLDRNNSGASSYPIHADEDISQFLKNEDKGFKGIGETQSQAIAEYKLVKDNGDVREIGQEILDGKLLVLPPNLHIWATMNTSDQSLFPIDSAFKRRWDWQYMPISYKPINKDTGKEISWKFKVGENLYSWGEFLSKINPQIYNLTESSDKQMGYFFAKADPDTGIISEEVFLNKVLFYLWTEVLKDYSTGQEIFQNPETQKTFVFTDFFDENQNALENFIAKLDLSDKENIELTGLEEQTPSSSELESWRLNFWKDLKTRFAEQDFDYKTSPTGRQYFQLSTGITNLALINCIAKQKGFMWTGIYIEKASAELLYNKLVQHRAEIDSKLDFELLWIPNDDEHGYASMRVEKTGVNFDDPNDRESALNWLTEHTIKIYNVFKPYFAELK